MENEGQSEGKRCGSTQAERQGNEQRKDHDQKKLKSRKWGDQKRERRGGEGCRTGSKEGREGDVPGKR